jgi:hypothetical protein
VSLPEFAPTTTFRWTIAISAAFAVCILLMFGFVYWQTMAYMTGNADQLNNDVTDSIVAAGRGDIDLPPIDGSEERRGRGETFHRWRRTAPGSSSAVVLVDERSSMLRRHVPHSPCDGHG